MNLEEVYPRTLKADDFKVSGPKTFTVKGVEVVELGEERERKPCFSFVETPHTFVCNKTNLHTITTALGTAESEEMIGAKVTLFADTTRMGGKVVDCIRVQKVEKGEPVEEPVF